MTPHCTNSKNSIMKKYTPIILLYCLFQLLANIGYSQDNIILKNGDEIAAKVLEVTTDQIKYKKWENQEGPTYTSAKSDIFMIKYKNGTKDVFNTTSPSNSNPSLTNTSNNGSKFIGTWLHKKYDGNNNRSKITISKSGEDYLVNYVQMEREPGDHFYLGDGTFKETGRIEGSSIIINSFTKLSLLNDNTILMQSEEFVKSVQQATHTNSNQQVQLQNNNVKIDSFYIKDLNDPLENRPPSESPKYRCYYNSLDSILDYNIWDNCLFFKSNKAFKAKHFLAQFSGFTHTQNRDDLRARIGKNTSILIIMPGLETKDKMLSYSISTSCTSTTGDKIFTKEKVKQIQEKRLTNDLQSIYLTYNFDPKDFPEDKNQIDVYVNFEIRDNLSDFIVSGFYKIKFFR